jgi:hypothetical protein
MVRQDLFPVLYLIMAEFAVSVHTDLIQQEVQAARLGIVRVAWLRIHATLVVRRVGAELFQGAVCHAAFVALQSAGAVEAEIDLFRLLIKR